MTRRQRAQVVELLRYGADEWIRGDSNGGIGTASRDVGLLYADEWQYACEAWSSVFEDCPLLIGFTYAHACLEAAARVEEGSWP